MLGTVANAGAIIIGGIAGSFFRKGISERFSNIIMSVLGLFTLVLGMTFAIDSQNALVVIFSLVIGSVIGEWIDIEKRMNDLGDYVQDKLNSREGSFSKGFVTASLLYCVGTMSIMGPLQSGLMNDHKILLMKSILDGTISVVFASTLGIGVALSSLPVLVYQGSIALLASSVAPYLSEAVITEMTAVGGVLLVGMGINLLEIKKLKVGNMLPAIFLPIILMLFMK
ncbi:MAG TPA: DUF554 domain-containing protein [Bacillota bacterium]|nr:DUF554 domain-containing protein [Bacillota bacterium]HRS21203.1 DUF554 domain-containing protein [Clostridia bacterium]HRU41820.1 DUF554 domain-containing protein [Candidatus Diapherotrites archaeon]HQE66030.1 DUF554 domain-containing protein [Bacillota bacterium]HQI15359.1 DUF554 domain-containing protein [Bacillota bacterium]